MWIMNPQMERLRKRLVKRTTILSDQEVAAVVKLMCQNLGDHFVSAAAEFGVSMQDGVRYGSLSAKCQEAREKRRMSIKQISAELKIPQYRLQAIEEGHAAGSFLPAVFKTYIAFLGIGRWVSQWKSKNKDFASRLGIL
ncbi:MAG: hypothetical protein A3G34_10670 [Candidatus Lindowbacteria bacterium RIFCSPLOWO2_12_FULL_62_27]|nr:MAG: hypothetical protein A3G34_10670 [Candidatus Lindowbacteria bacterium RIFCSPLOWO2_12_FULL_62_27]